MITFLPLPMWWKFYRFILYCVWSLLDAVLFILAPALGECLALLLNFCEVRGITGESGSTTLFTGELPFSEAYGGTKIYFPAG